MKRKTLPDVPGPMRKHRDKNAARILSKVEKMLKAGDPPAKIEKVFGKMLDEYISGQFDIIIHNRVAAACS